MNTGLDQYMDIFKDAVEDSAAKLTKSFEKILIEVIILFMVIPRRINFTQMGRYGSHVEQTYRNAFGLKKSKSIDWLKLNVSLAKRFFGKQGRWAIAIDPSYISKAGKKTPHIGRFWSGCAQSVKHGLEIMGIGLIDIHHISMIAKYSKKVNTPRLYIYLLRQMGLDKSLDVKVEFLPMKQYLGLVELDEHGNILLDDKGEPVMNKYPKFSQFRKQVLDVVREDLNRMASRSETDIVFDEFSEEDFIYRNGKHKGDPEYVIFHIKRTDVGINHIGDKDADIARRLNEKINRNRGKKTSDDATQQGDLFAHVYQNPDKKIEVDTTQGFEQWNQFISMVQDTSQQALLGRCKFIGIKNDRFCIAASDDDFAALKTSGLERLAQEFFDCVGSFMPVFYRG